MTRAARLALAWLFATLTGCRALPEIEVGICGNGVIEPPEDCDDFYRDGGACRPPGISGECRFDCSPGPDGERPACQAGWGCDLTGVCRRATGGFLPPLSPILANAESLQAGDFDGDGRDDILSLEPGGLLGVTKMRVHYFDEHSRHVHTWASPRVVTTPIVRDVSGDGRADLLFSDFRVGVLQGEPDRSLVAVAYPSYVLQSSKFRVFPVLDVPIDDSAGLLVLIEQDGRAGLYYRDRATGEVLLANDLGAGIRDLSSEPAIGDVLQDDDRYPCRDVAVAVQGADRVLLYSPCERDLGTGLVQWRTEFEERTIPLEPPAKIDGPVLLADLNGDVHLDLMVGAGGGIYVAHGDGTELTAARPYRISAEDPIIFGTGEQDPSIDPQAMPLAAGDFSGDGAADLVFQDLIVVSTRLNGGGVLYRGIHSKFGAPWTSARVADLNGDHRLDVVAASDTGFDIDFFLGTGADALNPFSISTGGPIDHLAIADLDGDLINDLAFVQSSSGAGTEDTLAVAFGKSTGPPAVPVPVTRLGGIEQLSMIYSSYGRVVANLLVLYAAPEEQQILGSRLALFESTSDRSFLSPIELTTFASDGTLRSGSSLGIVSGAFAASQQVSVVSLAQKGDLLAPDPSIDDFGIWLLSDTKSRVDPPLALAWPFGDRVRPVVDIDQVRRQTLRMASGDLDSDGVDELLMVGPTFDLESCALSSSRFDLADTPRLFVSDSWTLPWPCVQGSQLSVVDVDRDLAPDIVLLTGAPSGPGSLLVLWNDGDGGFDAGVSSSVAAPSEAPRAFTWLETPEGDALVLAYVTARALQLTRTRPGGRTFERFGEPFELERGTGVSSADVDGDRVVDLVVADDGVVRVLRAELEP